MICYEIGFSNPSDDDPSVITSGILYDSKRKINSGITKATFKREINQPGSMSISMICGNQYAQLMKQRLTSILVITRYYNGDTIVDFDYSFCGRISSVNRDIYGNLEIECEGLLASFNDVYYNFNDNGEMDIGDLLGDANRYLWEGTYQTYFDYHASTGADIKIPTEREFDDDDDDHSSEAAFEWHKIGDLITDKTISKYSSILYFVPYFWNPQRDAADSYAVYWWAYCYIKDINPGMDYNFSETVDEHGTRVCSFPTKVPSSMTYEYGVTYPSFGIGDNILEINKAPIRTQIWSCVVGISDKDLSEEGMFSDYAEVTSESLKRKYGYVQKLVTFPGVETESELRRLTEEYVSRYSGDYGDKLTVKAIEPCEVFDDINVITRVGHFSYVKDIDNTVYGLPCVSISRDIFNIENSEYVFSSIIPEAQLDEDISAIKKKNK